MTNKAILTEAGIIIINDKFEVLQSHRFEPDSEISLYSQIKNSNLPEGVKTFLDDSYQEFSDSIEVNDQSFTDSFRDEFPIAHMGHSFPTAGEWIQKMRDEEARQTRTQPEDSINKALEDMEFDYGSDDPTKQEVLLQLPSSED